MEIKSFRNVIELWPSRKQFAAALGIKPHLASLWWQRDIIQPEYFMAVSAACADMDYRQVTVDFLLRLYTEKKRERNAA